MSVILQRLRAVAFIAATSFAFSALTVHADPPGQVNVNCNMPGALQDAINDVKEGTVIRVNGHCTESVFIEKDRIKLIGNGGATMTAPAGSFTVVEIRGSNVEIRNFDINAAGVQLGVLVNRGGSASIVDNDVMNRSSALNVGSPSHSRRSAGMRRRSVHDPNQT